MKPGKNRTKEDSRGSNETLDLHLNDIGFRLVLIPFFGIAIPLVTNMIDAGNLGHWQLKLAYGYTILLAFVI